MAAIHTHYDNLRVSRNASTAEIRAAYKSLSQRYHPDRNGDSPEAARVMTIVNEAYRVLSDPIERSAHDAWIIAAEFEARQRALVPVAPSAGRPRGTGAVLSMIGRGLLVGVGSALAAVIALTLAVAGLAAISHYLDPPEETAERLPDPRGHA